jgi:hypothetical protein
MHTSHWLVRAAYRTVASDASSQLGQIAFICVLGLIASTLIITPGDHAFAKIYAVCAHITACD